MFTNNLNKLKNKNIFINKQDLNKDHYKKIKVILTKFHGIKITETKPSSKVIVLFFNPVNYYKSNIKNKILLTLNFDNLDGKIENLYHLNKTGLLDKNDNDEIFSKKFRKFFLEKSKKISRFKKKINIFNYLLLKINLRLSKYYIRKNIYIPYIKSAGYFKEIVEGRNIVSLSSYNCFFPKKNSFLKLYSQNYKKLSDKHSKEIYKKVIFDNPIKIWRMYISNIFKPNQYFDHIKLNKNSAIINCGVDKGYEIPEFLSYNVKKIYNIDPSGIKHLHPYIKNYANIFREKLNFIKKALYTTGTIYVHNNNKVTTLSKLLVNLKLEKIDLIKSDIEGAEKMLIDELDPVIKKYRPQLAISIYHIDDQEKDRFSHIVLLPNKLMQICKNYKFYIKHYSFDRRETIMYCIPK